MSKRILVRKADDVKARSSLDPHFDALNDFIQRYMKGGDLNFNTDVTEGFDEWQKCEPGDNCDTCLLCENLEWIENQHIQVSGNSLCNLMYQIFNLDKIKKRKRVDILDVPGGVLPGNFEG